MEYILTSAGAELLTKLTTNGNSLHLSKAKSGSGYSTNPEHLTDVIDEQATVQIADAKIENSTAVITTVIYNVGLAEGYRIKQLGIFAVDDEMKTEILFIIGQDIVGDKLPAEAEGTVEYKYIANLKVSNTSNIVVDINDSDFVLKKTFNSTVNDINQRISYLEPIISDEENLAAFVATGTPVAVGQTVIIKKTVYTLVRTDYSLPDNYSSGVNLSDEYKIELENGSAAGGTGASQKALCEVYNLLNDEMKFKASIAVMTDNDISTTFSDGSSSVTHFAEINGLQTVTTSLYDADNNLLHQYKTVFEDNKITQTEVF